MTQALILLIYICDFAHALCIVASKLSVGYWLILNKNNSSILNDAQKIDGRHIFLTSFICPSSKGKTIANDKYIIILFFELNITRLSLFIVAKVTLDFSKGLDNVPANAASYP